MNNIIERVERSIFKAINDTFLTYGYTANPADVDVQGGTELAEANWRGKLKTIEGTKGWAMETFPAGSQRERVLKRTPRIVIEPMTILPGDIGTPKFGSYKPKVGDNTKFTKSILPYDSSHLSYDIHIAYSSTNQRRVLNTLLAEAIGPRTYLPFYDNPEESFYIEHLNFYDISDSADNIQEKVYSYVVKDIFLFETVVDAEIAKINEITLEINLASTEESVLTLPDSEVYALEVKESLIIDLSNFNI